MSKHKKQNPGFGTMSRRQLLTALGLSAGGLFLPSLGWRKGAKAQSTTAPRRLVIFVSAHGVVPETWRMRRDHTDFGDWEYAFDDNDPSSFSETLQPLHAHRQKLLVIEGLSQMSTLADYSTNNHNAAAQHLLTCAMMQDDNNAGGPSVDQIIANEVAVPGRIPSLELSSLAGLFVGGFVNFAAGQRAPTSDNPQAVFDRLFPPGSTPTNGEDPPEPTERDLIRGARGSVLDLVGDEYEAIAPRLGAEDRMRLDQHRQLVRDLEQRVGTFAQLSCNMPPERSNVTSNNRQLEITRAMIPLASAALACDLTRVVTIQVGQLDNDEFGAPAGDVHQDFAHQTASSPVAAQQMTNYNRVHADLFGQLMSSLDQYSEGDGTVLDNTTCLWISELATGPHELWQIPIVMGGSMGGAFKMGRYLSYAQKHMNPIENPDWEPQANFLQVGPATNHLFVSLMQAMGLDRNSIGVESVTTRPKDGSPQTINTTGPLPRLT